MSISCSLKGPCIILPWKVWFSQECSVWAYFLWVSRQWATISSLPRGQWLRLLRLQINACQSHTLQYLHPSSLMWGFRGGSRKQTPAAERLHCYYGNKEAAKKQPRVPLPWELTQCPATDGNRCRCGEMGTTSRNPRQSSPPFLPAADRFLQPLGIQVCSILFTYWKACEFAIGLKSLFDVGEWGK